MTDKIRIGSILNESLVNGEGIRTVVFFSGCNKFCKGCQNEGLQDFKAGYDISIDDLVEKILENRAMIDGVTLSGGDPLYPGNVLEVYEFIMIIKNKYPNKNIWLYTGYTLEQLVLKDNIFINGILNNIDVLVDGQFIEELKDIKYKWAGSTNQRVLNKEQIQEIIKSMV